MSIIAQEIVIYNESSSSLKLLILAIQELSLAKNINTIMAIVRKTARELTGADGATFVLRDKEQCYYAEENAIAPLWKGLRFPMSACISGWAMLNKKAVIIEDIYKDDRIPADAYRPTFVKSLAMVPIRTVDPIGAIGNYWATQKICEPEKLELLQALADSTAVAMENVRVYEELEERVRDRTEELRIANKELEAFTSAASHDLRAPIRHIEAFSQMVLRNCEQSLDTKNLNFLNRVIDSAKRMSGLIDDMLSLSRVSKTPVNRENFDLAVMTRELMNEISPNFNDLIVSQSMPVDADHGLIRTALTNMLSNAWKYSSKRAIQIIEVGTITTDGEIIYFVRDNGAGFDSSQARQLFEPFRRFHSEAEFPGTGVGLATVYRIITRHEGRIWAESKPDQGATFFFTLNKKINSSNISRS